MLSESRSRQNEDEQDGNKSRHVSINAAGAVFERGVQNAGFCVYSCMDNADVSEQTVDKKKQKKDKVRSAWISFAGRIVAQLVGAIATVALGVMVLHRYTSTDTRPPAPEHIHAQPAASAAEPGQASVHVIVLTPGMLGLRDAHERVWPADRACTAQLDGSAASAAHLDKGTFLSR